MTSFIIADNTNVVLNRVEVDDDGSNRVYYYDCNFTINCIAEGDLDGEYGDTVRITGVEEWQMLAADGTIESCTFNIFHEGGIYYGNEDFKRAVSAKLGFEPGKELCFTEAGMQDIGLASME